MIRFVLSLAFSLAVLFSFAQNLVPNPSFEEYIECPFSLAGLENELVDWYSWQESPDFYHSCSNELEALAGVPQNVLGYQWPITGQGYAGVLTFADYLTNVREYMAAPLNSSLVTGESYYVMFYASLCDSSELITRKCATNNLGIRFFKNPSYSFFPTSSALQADNFAHLNHNWIITDDQDWTLIEGWFTADDMYNWISIGNFFDDENTSTEILNNQERCTALYYVENVCVASDPADCDYMLSNEDISLKTKSITVFPNPARGLFNVIVHSGNIESIQLFDTLGKEVMYSSHFASKNVTVDVSTFQKGIYVLKVKTNNHFFTQRILVK